MSERFENPDVATADDVECRNSCGDRHADGRAVASQHPRRRPLERSVSWTSRERLRCYWLRLRLTVAEMSYASRRLVELQAPWVCDSGNAKRQAGPR